MPLQTGKPGGFGAACSVDIQAETYAVKNVIKIENLAAVTMVSSRDRNVVR